MPPAQLIPARAAINFIAFLWLGSHFFGTANDAPFLAYGFPTRFTRPRAAGLCGSTGIATLPAVQPDAGAGAEQ